MSILNTPHIVVPSVVFFYILQPRIIDCGFAAMHLHNTNYCRSFFCSCRPSEPFTFLPVCFLFFWCHFPYPNLSAWSNTKPIFINNFLHRNGREYLYEALDYVAKGKVKVKAETFPLDDIADVYEKVANGNVRFRAVINV